MSCRHRALGPWPVRVLLGLSVPFGFLMLVIAGTLTYRVLIQTFGPLSAISFPERPASPAVSNMNFKHDIATAPFSSKADIQAKPASRETTRKVLGANSSSSSPLVVDEYKAIGPAATCNQQAAHCSSVTTSAKADDSEKDALSNAMSAIGTAVAVLALILTLGTTWFANLLGKIQDEFRTIDERQRQQEHSLEIVAALIRAKRELSVFIGKKEVIDGSDLVTQWGLALETLSADDLELRFDAYRDLFGGLRIYASELPDIARYCSMCHELAVSRLEQDKFGGRRSVSDVRHLIDQGLWCKLFDPAEHEIYRRIIEGR